MKDLKELLIIIGGVFLFSDLNRIRSKGWINLNKEELKVYSIYLFFYTEILGLFLCLLFYFVIHVDFLLSFLGMIIVGAIFSVLIYNRDFLDEKYDLISGKFIGMSYQSVVVILFPLTFAMSWFFALFSFTVEGLDSAIAFGLAMYFPFVFMFSRLDVFSDENSRLVSDQQVIGYHPVFFYLLGFMLARGPLGISLLWVIRDIISNFSSFNHDIISLIISLLCGCLILSPDVMNRILPFEIKTFEGLFKYCLLSVILIGGVLFIIMFLRFNT